MANPNTMRRQGKTLTPVAGVGKLPARPKFPGILTGKLPVARRPVARAPSVGRVGPHVKPGN